MSDDRGTLPKRTLMSIDVVWSGAPGLASWE
jgi:hypothetical protein